jgi:hypothetical protein
MLERQSLLNISVQGMVPQELWLALKKILLQQLMGKTDALVCILIRKNNSGTCYHYQTALSCSVCGKNCNGKLFLEVMWKDIC